MNIREKFEKIFPVPTDVVWNGETYHFIDKTLKSYQLLANELIAYRGKWIGFKAGCEEKENV